MKGVSDLIGIEKLNITAYHPQFNEFQKDTYGYIEEECCEVWSTIGSISAWSVMGLL